LTVINDYYKKAMILKEIADLEQNSLPLKQTDIPSPVAGDNEVLVKILECDYRERY
jgi:hypothetical protein